MERTIDLNGRKTRIKGNAMATYIYNNNFNSDLIADTFNALGGAEVVSRLMGADSLTSSELASIVEGFSAITIYQLLWALERNADRNTPPFNEWLEKIEIGAFDLILNDDFLSVLMANFSRKN